MGYDDHGNAYFRRVGNGRSEKGKSGVCEVHYQHMRQKILTRMKQESSNGLHSDRRRYSVPDRDADTPG